jgi:phage tail-like protein
MRADGNVVVPDGEDSSGIIVTGSADSTEHDFIWKNILIDAAMEQGIIVKVSAYAANTTIITTENGVRELDSLLSDRTSDPKERLELIDKLFVPLFSECTDGPINLKGRYIWIKLEFIMLESRALELKKIKLLLKSESMMDYLPEVYRTEDGENGFLARFLSIFDSLFFEMDDAVAGLSKSLDYRTAKGQLLRYLSEWICVDDVSYLTDEQLRDKIRAAISDYRSIGVKKGLVSWIENEYGVTPNIVEYYNVRSMIYEGKDREVYHRLFGDNPYKFFVILPEGVFSGAHETNLFMQRLKKRIPAYTEAEVIITKRNIILENHTYLGVNTVIGDYTEANTDVGSSMAHDIILGGNDHE